MLHKYLEYSTFSSYFWSILTSIINLFHQGYDFPVGYELLSLVDWYRHGVWQICVDVTEEYATSFVRLLYCLGDEDCKFPLNVSISLVPYTASHFRTR